MIIEKGHPADLSGRSEIEVKTYDMLDSLSIEYVRADHEAAMTMEDCALIDEALDCRICKNLLLTNRQGTAFYLLMMPGDKPFKTKDISSQIGSARLSFAFGEMMTQLLGITPGSLSVLGLMNDTDGKVRLLVDRDLLSADYIGCHPCMNTSSLKVKRDDIFEKFLPATNHSVEIVEL